MQVQNYIDSVPSQCAKLGVSAHLKLHFDENVVVYL